MADPVSVMKDFDAAWNAHDVEGVMAFFTDDAVVRVEPPPPDEFGGVYIQAKSRYALGGSSHRCQVSTLSPETTK
jgi:ketosteroid isomerase-like protein